MNGLLSSWRRSGCRWAERAAGRELAWSYCACHKIFEVCCQWHPHCSNIETMPILSLLRKSQCPRELKLSWVCKIWSNSQNSIHLKCLFWLKSSAAERPWSVQLLVTFLSCWSNEFSGPRKVSIQDQNIFCPNKALRLRKPGQMTFTFTNAWAECWTANFRKKLVAIPSTL